MSLLYYFFITILRKVLKKMTMYYKIELEYGGKNETTNHKTNFYYPIYPKFPI